MNQIKRLLCLAAILPVAFWTMAQSNGSNSSYSRFGLGTLNEQSQGFNRAMAGVAQGVQGGEKVNMLNPASYAAIDSLTFLFDVGMGMQMGRIANGSSSMKVFNASLEYVNAGLRLRRGLGLSFGFVPYSTIGYNFNTTTRVGSSYTSSQPITTTTTYYGNGGLHELYLGMGWTPVANLSIGANIGYVWGVYDHSLAQVFYEGGTSNSTYNSQNEVWNGELKTYKLDIGVQYPIQLNKQHRLTLGATASIGHTIKSKVELMRYTSQGDTIKNEAKSAFELPYTVSVGGVWNYKQNWTVAADYAFERWNGCKTPLSQATPTANHIVIATDQYLNRHQISAGMEYVHDRLSKRYGQRIYYRLGTSYASPYVKVNGVDGPKEYSITAGVGLPLTTRSKSLVNVSAEWLRRAPGASNMITENYFMLHLGVTFNEEWFMKWKFN